MLLRILFAQRKNLLNFKFVNGLREILRFNREAPITMDSGELTGLSLGEFLSRHKYRKWFVENFILPMGGAIWSTPQAEILNFPASNFISFFRNHGLLSGLSRTQVWRTVDGGSKVYVNKIIQKLGSSAVVNRSVVSISRSNGTVDLTLNDGSIEKFDHAVICSHAPEAMKMVTNKTPEESNLLEKFKLDQCYLLNDWESIGDSLKGTPEDKIEYIKSGVQINSNSLVLGPGTGLGAAFTSTDSVIATELGNTTNWTSSLLKNFAINNDNSHYKTLEDIVSGSGISKLYKSLSGESISAEEVIKRFNQNEDLALDIINGFIKSLANVLSDAALAYVPGNGIFLAGGVSRTLLPLIDKELFEDHFLENKSVIHKELLGKIRIGVIIRELTCLYGNLNYFNLLNKVN